MNDWDPTYVVAAIVAVSAVLGGAVTQGIRWLAGRPTSRADMVRAEADARRSRTGESEAIIRHLTTLIEELRTARDRDREEAVANREAIARLEAQVKKLEERISILIAEAKTQTQHIGELRERLRGAGVEPPAEPGGGES